MNDIIILVKTLIKICMYILHDLKLIKLLKLLKIVSITYN